MGTTFLDHVSVFVSTFKKYNEGKNLEKGEWVNLGDFDSYGDFYEYCKKNIFPDETDPEIDIEDYDIDLSRVSTDFLKNADIEDLWVLKEVDEYDAAPFAAYLDLFGFSKSLEKTVEDFQDRYEGEYDNDSDMAYEIAVNIGIVDEAERIGIGSYQTLADFIDWDAFSKFLMDDYVSKNGYYFRNY